MSLLDRLLGRHQGFPSSAPSKESPQEAIQAALDKAAAAGDKESPEETIQGALNKAATAGDRDKVQMLVGAFRGRPYALKILDDALTVSRLTRWHAVTRDLEQARQLVKQDSESRGASLVENEPILAHVPMKEGKKYLAPCQLLAEIGRGGMGVVYRAYHTNLGVEVAVKCLHPAQGQLSSDSIELFRREARAAASVQSGNVVRVFDVLSQFGVHYIIMEYVHGETSRDRVLRVGALPLNEALFVAREAARGLAMAHQAGIIHRDVKPDNVLISDAGEIKVSDLGLANPDAGRILVEAGKAIENGQSLLLTNAVFGTPLYMAPEQWTQPRQVRPTADVWVLGSCLYFLLVGDDPTLSGSPCGFAGQFADVRKARTIPTHVALVIEKATARSPDRRYPSCVEFGDELDRMLAGVNIRLQ